MDKRQIAQRFMVESMAAIFKARGVTDYKDLPTHAVTVELDILGIPCIASSFSRVEVGISVKPLPKRRDEIISNGYHISLPCMWDPGDCACEYGGDSYITGEMEWIYGRWVPIPCMQLSEISLSIQRRLKKIEWEFPYPRKLL